MPQYPPVNTNAENKYRDLMIEAFKARDWITFVSCIESINGTLPTDLKFRWGSEPDRDKRYVKCPSSNCGKPIEYTKKNIKIDPRYWRGNPKYIGDQSTQYIECECADRVYIDQGNVEVKTLAVDMFSLITVLQQPPSLNPPVPEEVMEAWAIMIMPVVEDRYRKWYESATSENS